MPRYKLILAYDGTDFHGWQRQEPPDLAPLRTVQGVLEEAVRVAIAARVSVTGASRTDAGVHAHGQVASFSADTRIPLSRVPLAINARLPDDVQVRSASLVREDFNPISDAVSKRYRYLIAFPTSSQGEGRLRPLFERRWCLWHIHALDLSAMQAAASSLVGEHDFAAFAHAAHGRESTVRRIHQCTVTALAPGRMAIDVAGNGFLYNMVRIIAGTLIEIGRGRLPGSVIPAALAAHDRTLLGPTAPAQGLCLEWVHYGGRDAELETESSSSEPASNGDTMP